MGIPVPPAQTLATLIFDGVLERFPDLHIGVIEQGAADLLDEAGYQKCTVQYPNLSADEIYQSVERFYRSFYFRPRYILKSVRKMLTSSEECKRLLKEGMQFLSTMRQRRAQMRHANTAGA